MEYEKRIREAAESAYDRGISKGSTNAQFDDIVSMMETLNLSFDQAIQALRVPAERVENYRDRIALKQQA